MNIYKLLNDVGLTKVFTNLKAKLDAKQDTLVSGTSIKTINNQSVMGSGNIDISGAFVATYDQTPYADVVAAIDANKPIIVDFPNNHNLMCVTYSTYGAAGSDVLMYAVYNLNDQPALSVITVKSTDAWSITHTSLQEILVSGTNIKTVNGNSLLGSGNIDTSEFVDVTYGVTPYATVKNAIDNKKRIRFRFNAASAGYNNVTWQAYDELNQSITLAFLTANQGRTPFCSVGAVRVFPTNQWVDTVQIIQERLVSGTNIKTLNNQSLLGDGNIDVGGGGVSIVERDVTNFAELASVLNSGNVIIVKDGDNNHLVIQTSAIPLPESQNNILLRCGTLNGTGVVSSHFYSIDKLSDQWTRYDSVYEGATQSYVDGITGDLSTLTTDNKTNLVSAINEVYEKSGEPFRIKNWANNALNVTIVPCTSDAGNTSLAKMVYTINDVEGADYQIVGMLAYEVFDAASGGNRINCWPVCQFTGNGQKELSVRWMCGGTTNKVAKRINAWVLLKHR